jgi:hypothetical protein
MECEGVTHMVLGGANDLACVQCEKLDVFDLEPLELR